MTASTGAVAERLRRWVHAGIGTNGKAEANVNINRLTGWILVPAAVLLLAARGELGLLVILLPLSLLLLAPGNRRPPDSMLRAN